MKIGDKVSWTHFSKGRGSFSLTLKKGEIVGFDGDYATIKTSKYVTKTILTARLRLEGEKSQITEFVEGVRENIPT
jgi:hypothetical protein